MQRLFVLILSTLLLASCSAVMPVHYTYQPPLDQEGAMCIKDHCEKSQTQCLSIGYTQHPECRPTAQNPEPGGVECHNLYHDCVEQYASCYAMCGGKVYADGKCMSCDKHHEEESEYSSQIED